ncbi:DUF1573 domain-containing protein [Xanthomarina sp. F2636L]|uniref:DUF1573 domain-containing protein n=1 Tax=Xanthomarina sp. F2636L TaxID=2996018 RepID=UPI00225E6E63|nr:DUF1573 domain-containing protein [Xanthomarina sp. F2636L]MCX7550539.1 DUF1573 domain-containing protein [Xanthomarina sp. F2636L]
MKKILIVLAVLALTACKNEKSKLTKISKTLNKSEVNNYPNITFEETEHDFGFIQQGDQVSTVFKFKNTGTESLVISSIEAKCGCTVPNDWPKEAILPGEHGQFEVQFNSTNKNGRIKQPITITSNSKAVQDVVTITATVN